jgi:hypothetical protein
MKQSDVMGVYVFDGGVTCRAGKKWLQATV